MEAKKKEWWPANPDSGIASANPWRDGKSYARATTEVRRVDMHSMTAEMKKDALLFARNLSADGGPFSRRHSMEERLRQYVNKRSRCGKYIEVLPEEVHELTQTSALLLSNQLLPVELGLNSDGQACKAAFTVPLLSSGRVAFLCIGVADGGLKTFYVNPSFKFRSSYQCSDPRLRQPARRQWSAAAQKKKKNVPTCITDNGTFKIIL